MQNTSVNIHSSEAVMFSKQKSRNSENLHRWQRKRNVSVREAPCRTRNSTTPWPRSRTWENLRNNVENIQEEIKSYLSSALQLFGQLPSGPITTGHPGTQSYQAKSTPTKQCLAFTPAIRPKEICPSLHAVAKIPKSWRNRSFC